MAITLFVKKPFTIDATNTLVMQKLYLNGGSILDTLTDIVYNKDRKEILEVPFITNYVYYNIIKKEYFNSDLDNLEDTKNKMLFKVYRGVDGTISGIDNVFEDDVHLDFDGYFKDIIVKDNIDVLTEQNLEILELNGNVIQTKYFPKNVINMSLAYTNSNGDKVSFGVMDLENVSKLGRNYIKMNMNLFRAVSLTLNEEIQNVLVDVTYSY